MNRGRPGRTRGARVKLAAGALAGLVVLTGCTGEEDAAAPPAAPSATASATPNAPSVAVETSVRKITGKIARAERDQLAAEVGALVDGWFQAAYLAGDFPRSAPYTAADFPGFSAGAAALAVKDDFLSNRAIAGQVDGVVPVSKAVALDVLAVNGRAHGITAKVDLVFETTGAVAGSHRVRGHLDLAPKQGRWQVFGFEITREGAAGGVR